MPAFYAHKRFGNDVIQHIPSPLQQVIYKYRAQFDIGLQGPDIFFFYKPYRKTKVATYGNHLHAISARPFFEKAIAVVQEHGVESEQYAYILGVICHYILDSECHPYVDEMIAVSKVEHLEIEEEFEKKLLRMDHQDALAYDASKAIADDAFTANAIVAFYPEVSVQEVRTSLQHMRKVKRLFCAPSKGKQNILNAGLKVTGNYRKLNGLMNQRVDNPACFESNEGLLRRYQKAVPVAVKMLTHFDDCVNHGTILDKRMDRTFE